MDIQQLKEAEHRLKFQLEELHSEIEQIETENFMLQEYCERNSIEEEEKEEERGGRRRKKKKAQQPLLQLNQKSEICQTVFDWLQEDVRGERRKYEKIVNSLRAVLQEADMRMAELRKEAFDFKREIVVGGESSRTGNIMAERVVRFLEERLKAKDSLVEKLRLRNTTLKAQVQQAENKLQKKEELGDALHYIDFHQLQIENKQLTKRIEEQSEELVALKATTGRCMQSLNALKRELAEKQEEMGKLSEDVVSKEEATKRVDTETESVRRDIGAERRSKRRLLIQSQDASSMPNVEDYMLVKREVEDMRSAKSQWNRKLELLQRECKKFRRQARMLRA